MTFSVIERLKRTAVAITAAFLTIGLASCEQQTLEDKFTDMTAIWTDQNTTYTVKLTGEDKYLVIGTPDFVPLGGPPELFLPATIAGVDSDNDVYNLMLSADPRNDFSKLIVGDGTQITTLRQIWD
ncbi:MAG: hypothetical protein AB7I36_17830, partial [Rhodospirillaceae bacterium]